MKERFEIYFDTLAEEPPAYIRDLENEALRHEVPIIRRATGELLRFFIQTNQPRKILEIGTAIGYSSLFMKECASKECRITTIEKVPQRIAEAKKNFAKYDTEHQICLLEGDAAEVLLELAAEKECFDMIFMDAAKGQYMAFLPYLSQMLPKGGMLISDNILHDGDILESRYAVKRRDRTIHARMREYLYTLTHHEEWKTLCLSLGDGATISVKMK